MHYEMKHVLAAYRSRRMNNYLITGRNTKGLTIANNVEACGISEAMHKFLADNPDVGINMAYKTK